MDEDEDDIPTCPLCLEELDATDRAVKACQCGYQVCLWCLHHIREQLNGRCPACRTPYEEQNFKFAQVNPEAAAKEAKERATAKKERERREKAKEIERERARAAAVSQQKAKSNLKHARFLQRNLVYVIGLSLTLAREEVLRRADMFGKFGRIIRVLVNRSHAFNADAPGGPSMSAYVQYQRDSDASTAARTMNNAVFDGRELRCAIATTKYCDAILRNAASADVATPQHCGNPNCMYLHVISPAEAVLTREEVLARQLGPPPPSHLFHPPDYRRLQTHLRAPSSNVLSTSAPLISSSRPAPIRTPTNHPSSQHSGGSPAGTSLTGPTAGLPVIHPLSIPISKLSTQNMLPLSHSESTSVLQPPPNTYQPLGQPSPNISTGSIPNLSSSNQTVSPATSVSNNNRLGQSSLLSPRQTPPATPPIGHSFSRKQTPTRNENANNHIITPSKSFDNSSLSRTNIVTSSPALPSSVGWASANSSRNPISTSPVKSTTSPFDDTRTRNRGPVKRIRENAPPGFEDPNPFGSLPLPSRPPGFDIPTTPTLKDSKKSSSPKHESSLENGKGASALPPPPGFGPGPGIKAPSTDDDSPKDSAAAWSQEASADKVFSIKEKRVTGTIGQIQNRSPQLVQNDAAARSELAQVLAKIGGNLGVSSEFQAVENPTTFSTGAMRFPPPGISTREPPTSTEQPLGTLFGATRAQSSFIDSQNDSNNLPKVADPTNTSQSSRSHVHGSNVTPHMLKTSVLGQKIDQTLPPRRNNSRFDFARQDPLDQMRSMSQATNPTVSLSNAVHPPQMSFFSPPTNGPTRGSTIKQPSSSANQPKPTSARQSRSRFDFVDHAASPLKISAPQQPPNGTKATITGAARQQQPKLEPLTDAFAASFAQLSTQEKLQSLFNSAQWSAEALPPMPSLETQLDPLSAIPPTSVPSVLNNSSAPNSRINVRSTTENERQPQIAATSHPVKYAPPGFREATPGTTPEKSSVEKTSTLSGVAGTISSGGEKVNTSIQNSSITSRSNESLTSIAESLEEDRKRSKAQRKKDKKSRQQKEVAEKNEGEPSGPIRSTPPVCTSVQAITKPDSNLKSPKHTAEEHTPTLFQVQEESNSDMKDTTIGQKENPKVLISPHLNDEPGKFMSVSELEREVEAARAREAQLRDMLLDIQRRIRSYDNVRT